MRSGSKRAQREARDASLKPEVVKIIGEDPAYGYRRIRPDLEAAIDEVVNHKRLRRLLNEWDLALFRAVSLPRPTLILCVFRVSRTLVERGYDGGRKKAHLIAMVDVGSCWVPGWAVGPSADRALALRCWKAVRHAYSGLGRDLAGIIVHQDQDPVFPSYA